jgi:hypothetical protein
MRLLSFAAALILGLVLTAAAPAKEKIHLNAADTAAARATLITRADLRPAGGWKGGPTKPDFSQSTCPYYHPDDRGLVVTGAAENDWDHQDRGVFSGPTVLQTSAMVRVDFRRSATAAALRCTAVRAGAKKVSVSSVSFPKLTQLTAAFRVTYLASGGLGQVMETALIGHGRTEITVAEVMATPAPLAVLHADVVRLARIMNSRVTA